MNEADKAKRYNIIKEICENRNEQHDEFDETRQLDFDDLVEADAYEMDEDY